MRALLHGCKSHCAGREMPSMEEEMFFLAWARSRFGRTRTNRRFAGAQHCPGLCRRCRAPGGGGAEVHAGAGCPSWAACFPCLAPPGASGVFVEPGGAGHRRDPAGGRGVSRFVSGLGLSIWGGGADVLRGGLPGDVPKVESERGRGGGRAGGRLDRRMPSSPGLSSSPRRRRRRRRESGKRGGKGRRRTEEPRPLCFL